jgi:uncharacterized protein
MACYFRDETTTRAMAMNGSDRVKPIWLWPWVACVLFALHCGYTMAAATVPAIRSHVSDYAQVLGARAPLVDTRLKAFEAATGHQVFLLTVKSIGRDSSIEEFAVDVFQKWKLGRKGSDDGVLFVVAIDDRKMRIEVGYGLEGALTDLKSSQIIREVVGPQFKRGDYASGIENGVDAILRVVQDPGADIVTEGPATDRDSVTGMRIFLSMAGLFLLLFMVMSLFGGLLGLLLMSLPGVALPIWMYPDWRGYAIATAFTLCWLVGRWRLIAANVRKYHLKNSHNKSLTWIRVFLFMSGTGRPGNKRRGSFFTVSYGISDGSSSSSSSSSDSSSGGGGRSGGGGASGSW